MTYEDIGLLYIDDIGVPERGFAGVGGLGCSALLIPLLARLFSISKPNLFSKQIPGSITLKKVYIVIR